MTMHRKTFALSILLGLSTLWLPNAVQFASGQVEEPPSQTNAANSDNFETLMRGPLHEAFAAPVSFNAQEGIVVPDKPPEPINELPPNVKPKEDAIWIPGYWAWDDQKKDFLWVSGVWRVPPPGKRWVPGYWMQVDGGYQWIAGFWAEADSSQVQYQPYPPDSLERGPSSPAPSNNYFWVSGCWVYRNNQYAWRPGYWARGYQNWVWVPSYYVWTPRGCIFVDGYWDYGWNNRGMCFAPIYFNSRAYAGARFSYRPAVALDVSRLLIHLFVRPNYSHYYYGDWYGRNRRNGMYASFNFHERYGYDPVYAHSRWNYQRQGIDFDERIRGWHDYLTKHPDRRPPHRWDQRNAFVKQNTGFKYANKMILGDNLQQMVAKEGRSTKLRKIEAVPQQQLRQTVDAVRQVITARKKVESQVQGGSASGAVSSAAKAAGRLRLPDLPGTGILRGAAKQAKGSTSVARPDRRLDAGGKRPNVSPPIDTRQLPPRTKPRELPKKIERPKRDLVPTPRVKPSRPRVPSTPRLPSVPNLPAPSLPFP